MAKTRVYELAQKLGLENKDLLEKLEQAGIAAANHMAVLEDADLAKFEAVVAAPKEERIEEQRISSGIIRRRRKEVPVPVVEAEPAQEEASMPEAEISPAAAEQVETAPGKPKVKTTESLAAESATASEAKTDETVVDAIEPEVSTEVKMPVSAAPAEKEPSVSKPVSAGPEKVTANRAKILGRVEIHQPAPRGAKAKGPQGERPAPGTRPTPGARPARPAAGERPAAAERPKRPGGPVADARGGAPAPMIDDAPGSGKEVRGKKKRKGKGGEAEGAGLVDGRRGRRSRMEVFEPDKTDRYRKGKKTKAPKKTEITVSKAIKRKIRISDVITVGELAKRMGVKANDLIKELMRQGNMVTINHPLDFETAAILASEFEYEVENVAFDEETILQHSSVKDGKDENPEDLRSRPPVVTIMGHVDHGKTSLLDAIRTTNVIGGEAGGITQHIGAYDVELDGKKISFLDTPGHEAFTAMRARGTKVTDIVILVVAADDGVMPQTKEAINHAKAAGVPIIVAVNKIDKPDANPDRVKQELTEFQLVPEEWGGDTIFVEVSAKENRNVDQLLEMILLQAEVLELKSNPQKRASGAIIEARLDKGRGPVATMLVQEGTLKVGDSVVSGSHFGRVRTMTNDRGVILQEAGPSMPVEVTGLSGVPGAGDTFNAVEDEKTAKEVAQHRAQKLREAELASSSKISLEQLYARIQEGDVKELKVIVKADVQGSVEAVKDALLKLSSVNCRLLVIHTGVGGIIESDVSLASASDAIVLGFNVRPEPKASQLAELEGVDIRLYNIIYDAVADVKNAMEGLLAPTYKEKPLGRIEVRDTFHVSRIGTIAGCYVLDGKVVRGCQVRLVRDSVVIWTGKMSSLKRFKDDAREVATGYECGIGLENFNDIKVGDIIEAFELEAVKTTLG
jgi:translation initiation factor IF-2